MYTIHLEIIHIASTPYQSAARLDKLAGQSDRSRRSLRSEAAAQPVCQAERSVKIILHHIFVCLYITDCPNHIPLNNLIDKNTNIQSNCSIFCSHSFFEHHTYPVEQPPVDVIKSKFNYYLFTLNITLYYVPYIYHFYIACISL